MSLPRDLRIGIVGAGIGGLTAALALQRAGFRPRIFEQAPVISIVGAGISITPNAAKGLEWLGLTEDLRLASEEPPRQIVRHWQTGEVLVDIDRGPCRATYGAAYYQLHRADLHRLLLTAVEAHDRAALVLGAAFGEAHADGTQAVTVRFGNGRSETFDLLIGADGVKSAVRARFFGHDDPQFTGHVAWRGQVPAERLASLKLPPGSSVAAGPGRSFVRYPMARGALINWVAFACRSGWSAESWSQRASREEVRAEFAGWYPEIGAIIDATPEDAVFKWGLFGRAPLPAWADGPVALIGDAAHPMLPYMGQGAAMAIEDAVILARCLSASSSIAEAFQRYQAARIARVAMITEESRLGADRLEGKEPMDLKNKPPRNEDTLGIFHYDPARVPV
jgi:salicylate hydroxylase